MAIISNVVVRRTPARCALLAVLLICCFGGVAQAEAPIWREGPSPSGLAPDEPLRLNTFAELAKELSPAVVSIDAKMKQAHAPNPEAFAQGSGFIISADGHILTNAHVVAGTSTIGVRMLDGRALEATVIGVDEATDLALIKVRSSTPLPTVSLGDSSALAVGEWVIAIGNPLGLDHTVTTGIVSAKGRRDLSPGGRISYADFIQTDASINPGNSGGPLFNAQGEVIGINTAINPMGQNIGFSIPINMAKTLIPQLLDGRVERSWIGVGIQPTTPEVAAALGLTTTRGALVSAVYPGSPAADAGLRSGDVILSFNGEAIAEHNELPWIASTAGVGKVVELEVQREKKTRMIELTMGALPPKKPARSKRRRRRR